MVDSKEQLKRQNYFDLKRDEWMAMDEYLLSPISEMDLRRMNEGGIANIENMTAPIGMAGGGDWKEELLGSKDDNATLNAMRDHPFQTALYLDLGFDKMFDLLSMIPMFKDGGAVGMKEGGLHPLVEFREIWEAYKLDGGQLEFKPYFDMLQEELQLMDYED